MKKEMNAVDHYSIVEMEGFLLALLLSALNKLCPFFPSISAINKLG